MTKSNSVVLRIMACLIVSCVCLGGECRVDVTDNGVFDIENEAAKKFLKISDAIFGEREGNFGRKFFDMERDYRADWPNVKIIEVRDTKASFVKMWLATSKNAKKGDYIGQFDVENGVARCLARNMVPGRRYYYIVESDDGRTLMRGTFLATGRLRMIATDKGFNIRDLGGWQGLGGKTVAYQQIYRGGSLGGTDKDENSSDISFADKDELYRLGIRAQLDLRAASDKGKYRGEGSLHSYSAGITTLRDADFCNIMTDYGAYGEDRRVVSDVAWIIYELKRGRPVYFNCRQGADRTGTVAFVIEGLLGCYEYSNEAGGNQMALDYELTGFSQANLIDNWKVSTSCRPAKEAYTNTHKLFRKLFDIKPEEPGVELKNLQQRCYYFLNRFKGFTKGKVTLHISADDLDWFICHMLGMSRKQYAPYRPNWAQEGNDLKSVAESGANVVKYQDN